MRAALSTLGVIIGVASLVTVLALGDGMERFARDQIEGEGYQAVRVEPIETDEVDGIKIPRQNVAPLVPRDAFELQPTSARPRGANVLGLFDTDVSRSMKLLSGRYITPDEFSSTAPVALLSDTLAAHLAKGSASASLVGQTIRFGGGAEARVVGIVSPNSRGPASLVIVPVLLSDEVMSPTGLPTRPRLEAHAANIEGRDRRESRGRSMGNASLRQKSETGVDRKRGYESTRTAAPRRDAVQGFHGRDREHLARGRRHRHHERAAGVGERTVARDRNSQNHGRQSGEIMRQFLAESVVVTGAGAAAGILLGLVAAFAFAGVMRSMTKTPVHAAFDLQSLMVAVLAAVVVGLVFGMYPALRAARLSPVEAIRHE